MQSLPILMIGLNHKIASISLRERLAFSPERVPRELGQIINGESSKIKEAVLLSTCNRTEVYACTRDSSEGEKRLRDFLADHAKLSTERLQGMLYVLRGEEVAKHLMKVAAGLDSLVLGENEILGQVRSAAKIAHDSGKTGPILSTLFSYAVRAGKRARTETEIGRGDVSVASVVVEMAEQAFGPLNDRTALLIGAGKISAITARALVKAGLHCVMIANRTFETAQKLARNLNGTAVHFDVLGDVLTKADLVICSTGAPHIVLHADAVAKTQKMRFGRPLLVADLAVPRDVDPEIASIPGVKLANIDDLDILVKTGHPLTASIYHEVETIVQQELENLYQWVSVRRCVPIIQALHSKAEYIYQKEVEKTLNRLGPLSPEQERMVEAMGKAIVNKMLHEPTICLRDLPPDEDPTPYLELIKVLYGIQ